MQKTNRNRKKGGGDIAREGRTSHTGAEVCGNVGVLVIDPDSV